MKRVFCLLCTSFFAMMGCAMPMEVEDSTDTAVPPEDTDVVKPDTKDTDGDTTPDTEDKCPANPKKTEPDGPCGCGEGFIEEIGDASCTCKLNDQYICTWSNPNHNSDTDDMLDDQDECPYDGEKTELGKCGCGINDSAPDCVYTVQENPDTIPPIQDEDPKPDPITPIDETCGTPCSYCASLTNPDNCNYCTNSIQCNGKETRVLTLGYARATFYKRSAPIIADSTKTSHTLKYGNIFEIYGTVIGKDESDENNKNKEVWFFIIKDDGIIRYASARNTNYYWLLPFDGRVNDNSHNLIIRSTPSFDDNNIIYDSDSVKEVRIIDYTGEWYKIDKPKCGFVHQDDIRVIDGSVSYKTIPTCIQ